MENRVGKLSATHSDLNKDRTKNHWKIYGVNSRCYFCCLICGPSLVHKIWLFCVCNFFFNCTLKPILLLRISNPPPMSHTLPTLLIFYLWPENEFWQMEDHLGYVLMTDFDTELPQQNRISFRVPLIWMGNPQCSWPSELRGRFCHLFATKWRGFRIRQLRRALALLKPRQNLLLRFKIRT